MSISCGLPQFSNHFMASIPSSYLNSTPPAQHLSQALSSSTFIDSFQHAELTLKSRQSIASSPSSSSSTENRVSKAKKGKRVHACEYPGCTKIFTRAEHRRRHELSHKNKKSHTCTYIGCHKSFHRADYLAQHIARHGGEHISPQTRHTPLIKTEPAAYSLSSPSISQTYPAKSPITNNFQSVESCGVGISRTSGQPTMPCSHCFGCQNCEPEATYLNNYSNAVNYSPISAISSPPRPLAAQASNTAFAPAIFDSVVENYMRSMLRPEAFITPPQSMSPPPQAEESMSASFWDANIDPNLPLLGPMIFHNDTPYPGWSCANGDISPNVQTYQAERPQAGDTSA